MSMGSFLFSLTPAPAAAAARCRSTLQARAAAAVWRMLAVHEFTGGCTVEVFGLLRSPRGAVNAARGQPSFASDQPSGPARNPWSVFSRTDLLSGSGSGRSGNSFVLTAASSARTEKTKRAEREGERETIIQLSLPTTDTVRRMPGIAAVRGEASSGQPLQIMARSGTTTQNQQLCRKELEAMQKNHPKSQRELLNIFCDHKRQAVCAGLWPDQAADSLDADGNIARFAFDRCPPKAQVEAFLYKYECAHGFAGSPAECFEQILVGLFLVAISQVLPVSTLRERQEQEPLFEFRNSPPGSAIHRPAPVADQDRAQCAKRCDTTHEEPTDDPNRKGPSPVECECTPLRMRHNCFGLQENKLNFSLHHDALLHEKVEAGFSHFSWADAFKEAGTSVAGDVVLRGTAMGGMAAASAAFPPAAAVFAPIASMGAIEMALNAGAMGAWGGMSGAAELAQGRVENKTHNATRHGYRECPVEKQQSAAAVSLFQCTKELQGDDDDNNDMPHGKLANCTQNVLSTLWNVGARLTKFLQDIEAAERGEVERGELSREEKQIVANSKRSYHALLGDEVLAPAPAPDEDLLDRVQEHEDDHEHVVNEASKSCCW